MLDIRKAAKTAAVLSITASVSLFGGTAYATESACSDGENLVTLTASNDLCPTQLEDFAITEGTYSSLEDIPITYYITDDDGIDRIVLYYMEVDAPKELEESVSADSPDVDAKTDVDAESDVDAVQDEDAGQVVDTKLDLEKILAGTLEYATEEGSWKWAQEESGRFRIVCVGVQDCLGNQTSFVDREFVEIYGADYFDNETIRKDLWTQVFTFEAPDVRKECSDDGNLDDGDAAHSTGVAIAEGKSDAKESKDTVDENATMTEFGSSSWRASSARFSHKADEEESADETESTDNDSPSDSSTKASDKSGEPTRSESATDRSDMALVGQSFDQSFAYSTSGTGTIPITDQVVAYSTSGTGTVSDYEPSYSFESDSYDGAEKSDSRNQNDSRYDREPSSRDSFSTGRSSSTSNGSSASRTSSDTRSSSSSNEESSDRTNAESSPSSSSSSSSNHADDRSEDSRSTTERSSNSPGSYTNQSNADNGPGMTGQTATSDSPSTATNQNTAGSSSYGAVSDNASPSASPTPLSMPGTGDASMPALPFLLAGSSAALLWVAFKLKARRMQ